ncbi:elongation of very long chain fatty acids protein-like [Apis florea]|uniref:elongation of very long chain fatty acids protein-like n=1 Tax=Apis florea TaxID=7463 RepID=UPI000629AC81|nr:elongation of very long chain fatty acids protein-like [Apis florea]
MATLIRRIYNSYRHLNENLSDPRTQDYFLIGSPWGYFSIIIFYLYFVHELGPSIMAKRKPFNLDKVVQIYNLVQIVLCAFLFYKAMTLAWLNDYSIYCQPVDFSYDPRALEISRMVWLYFVIKLLDLLDTVFFVLRKKQKQISFLHVYHHTGMTFGTWVCTKFLPGGHITFLGTVNCFVHVIMYTYYLVTSLQKETNKLWWKKYVTQLQLTQFFVILVHFVLLAWGEDCGFPKWTAAVMIPQNLFMIVLFADFYYKTYIKKYKKSSTNGITPNEKLKSQ